MHVVNINKIINNRKVIAITLPINKPAPIRKNNRLKRTPQFKIAKTTNASDHVTKSTRKTCVNDDQRRVAA